MEQVNHAYTQYVDGIPFTMKAPFSFSFLSKYGTVFAVLKEFDERDGGNACFGIEKDGKRYFLKFAGAPREQCSGNPQDAVDRLKASVQVYHDIGSHPNLIRFLRAEAIGGGFATIFEWTDARNIGRVYSQNHDRFFALPIAKRLRVFDDVMTFHEHVRACGYVAIDFYDCSIMYDFDDERTIICDIDFYQKAPYLGAMGLWGSTRFVSPEECAPGMVMDEATTVYTMGAAAFYLFADSDRSRGAWPLGDASYDVVMKAVRDDRRERRQSIRRLMEEWRAAIY